MSTKKRGRPPVPKAERRIQIRGSLSPAAAAIVRSLWWSRRPEGTIEDQEEVDRLLAPALKRRRSAS